MKKNNKNRFRYWFDKQMSAGAGALIRLLTLLALIIIVIVALILLATEGPSSPEGFSPIGSSPEISRSDRWRRRFRSSLRQLTGGRENFHSAAVSGFFRYQGGMNSARCRSPAAAMAP